MAVDTLDGILDHRECQPHELVEVLLDVQESRGHVSQDAMRTIAQRLNVALIDVYSAASFYKAFSLKPRGRHTCTVCMGTACHVRGAPLLLSELEGQLDVKPGETTEDGEFTLERVNCVGACALGPVVIADGVYRHHLTPAGLRRLIKSIEKAEVKADA
jgi:NADH:ubiquinone oxidoreductase subunit E